MWLLVYPCFSLKTQHQQHNLQGLGNKSFSPCAVSSVSVVVIPGEPGRRCPSPSPGGARSEAGDGGLHRAGGGAAQPRVPGVALVDERGARPARGAAPRRGPRLPRGSTTVTAAGGVGGPGAVGSGRGELVNGHGGGTGWRSKAKARMRGLMRKDEEKGR